MQICRGEISEPIDNRHLFAWFSHIKHKANAASFVNETQYDIQFYSNLSSVSNLNWDGNLPLEQIGPNRDKTWWSGLSSENLNTGILFQLRLRQFPNSSTAG